MTDVYDDLNAAEIRAEVAERDLATAQARLGELLRCCKIWRAWWNGNGGPHVVSLVEKIDLIASLEAASRRDARQP